VTRDLTDKAAAEMVSKGMVRPVCTPRLCEGRNHDVIRRVVSFGH
jgi:hypothetical protein